MDNHKFVDKSKGGIVLERLVGPGGLRAPPEVALPCIGGHCYYQLSVFFFSLSLVFTSFAFDPLRGNSGVFSSFDSQRSFMAAWATPSPWSIIICCFPSFKVG